MNRCIRREGQMGYDNISLYIGLSILYEQSLKHKDLRDDFDESKFEKELLRYVDEPVYVKEIVSELQSEGFIKFYKNNSGNQVISVSDNGIIEFEKYHETEEFKNQIKIANETLGRKFPETKLFEYRMIDFTIPISHMFFVSFVYVIGKDY